jgi:hypothetical protein
MKSVGVSAVAVDKPSQPRWQVKLLALLLMAVVTLALLEVAASVLYFFVVSPQLEARRADASHYYRASKDPLLAYEPVPGFQLHHNDRDLAINSFGLRGPEPISPKTGVRFAVLGDSVTFGILQGEAQTVSRLMEDKLRRVCSGDVEVFNLGVPGYGAQEVNELLRTKAPLLALDGVVYLLNLNDFARRNTLWEGADSGLYRMYQPPALKLPFFLQKALYRWQKGGKDDGMTPSLDWYRWLINGTFRETLDEIASMKLWAKAQGISFAVSVYPSGVALSGGVNALAREQQMVANGLQARGITVADDIGPFLSSPNVYDATDHLTDHGNDVASTLLIGVMASVFPDLVERAGCKPGAR